MSSLDTRRSWSAGAPRTSRGARVAGYLIAVAINLAFAWFLNVAPGWRRMPFLSEDFAFVVGVVTFSLVLSAAVNLAYVALHPPWVKHLGDALTAAVGFLVMLRLAQIFPFDFGSRWVELETPFRVLLGVGCLGAAIGVIANIALLVRALVTSR